MYLYTIVSEQYVKCVVCEVQGKCYAAYAVKLLTAFYQSVVCAGVPLLALYHLNCSRLQLTVCMCTYMHFIYNNQSVMLIVCSCSRYQCTCAVCEEEIIMHNADFNCAVCIYVDNVHNAHDGVHNCA